MTTLSRHADLQHSVTSVAQRPGTQRHSQNSTPECEREDASQLELPHNGRVRARFRGGFTFLFSRRPDFRNSRSRG